MAWFHRDRAKRPRRERRPVPDGSWDRCAACGHLDLRDRFVASLQVCPSCGAHRRLDAAGYIQILTDFGSFVAEDAGLSSQDPLRFPEYAARIERARGRVGAGDSIVIGVGRLEERPIHLGIMRFGFMGGSMGGVVGEKICRLAQRAVDNHGPLVVVSQSGGARMQEGALSLMQMAKTTVALAALKRASLPYISVLTDPTTGGVLAAHGMQGDITIAEPGALVGFSGRRVIKQAIGQDLPSGFQTAEFQAEHGQVDLIVPRDELRRTVGHLLGMMGGGVTADSAGAPRLDASAVRQGQVPRQGH